jgi:RNA polymerase sigma factor FliA
MSPGDILLKIKEHMAMVPPIARAIAKRRRTPIPFEDLVGYGNEGLADAVRKFDVRKHAELESYAAFRVRGEILSAIRKRAKQDALVMTESPTLLEMRQQGYEQVAERSWRGDPREREEGYLQGLIDEDADAVAGAMIATAVGRVLRLEGEEAIAARQAYARAITAAGEAIATLTEWDRRLVHLKFFGERVLGDKPLGELLGLTEKVTRTHTDRVMYQLGKELRARGVAEAETNPEG